MFGRRQRGRPPALQWKKFELALIRSNNDSKMRRPNEQHQIEPHGRPALAAGVRLQADPITGNPVLLFPEGILVLNETAKEVVSRCDGTRTAAEIATALAEEYDGAADDLLSDIKECLRDLEQRRLIVFHP